MKVEIVHMEKDSRELPTKHVDLKEHPEYDFGNLREIPTKKYHSRSYWYADVEPSEFGAFLVNLESLEDNHIGFRKVGDYEYIVWIGVDSFNVDDEDAPWG